MDKNSPKTPKRKSLANNATPNKLQKTGPSPNKNNKSPAQNQKTPQNQKGQQKKQFNGRQNTPRPPKVQPVKSEDDSEDENGLEEESDEELVQNGLQVEAASDSDNEVDEDDDEEDSDDESEENTQQKPQQKNAPNPENRKFSAFLQGLPYTAKDGEIKSFFAGCNIINVVFLKHRDNKKPNGRAFVNFKDDASLKKALKKNGSQMNNRTITVKMAFKNDGTNVLERKKRVLAALKRKVEALEAEISSGGTESPKKQKNAAKKIKVDN